jgi:hypothetical protein
MQTALDGRMIRRPDFGEGRRVRPSGAVTPDASRPDRDPLMRRRIALILASALLAMGVVAQPAAAGKPEMERADVNEVGVLEEFLTDVCGTDIWLDVTGHAIFKIWFDADGNPVREINNFALRRTFYNENGSISTVDVGPDRVWYNADGSIELFVTGNIGSLTVPGQGKVVANAGWTHFHITFDENGEAIFEFVDDAGQHWGDDVEVLCEVLG